MINLVLQEIRHSREPLSLTALSEKLDIERGALEGMLAYCVRKGWLRDGSGDEPGADGCATGSCGSTCTGIENCSFVAKMPRVYSPVIKGRPTPPDGNPPA